MGITMINFGTKKTDEEEKQPEPSRSGIKFGAKVEADKASVVNDKKDAHDQPVRTGKPSGLFHTKEDDFAEELAQEVLAQYPGYATEIRTIKNMIKQLNALDYKTVSEWGESVVVKQRELVTNASNRMAEFNTLNGAALLAEVLEFSKQSGADKTFFQKLTNKFSNIETYTVRVAGLKQQITSLFPILQSYDKDCKSNLIPMYLSVLAAVADHAKPDALIEETLYNRRILLNGVLKNIQILDAKLEQSIELASNMLNEISRIMDVVLPAIKMRNS